MKLEKKVKQKRIKIKGFKEITSEEFHTLKPNQGLRIFDYYQGCTQLFYRKYK
ncbi:hypothetical protein LCGC14_1402580 [marine sediment metagenome]|uniref:Uncharacterized protein n=1 Tax=marine sediment metagenome TaxID=412755 RepID=A0A0F9KHJ5_9ZZZZ